MKNTDFRKYYPAIAAFIIFLLAVIIRWKTLYDFCFQFTDSDQLLLWDAANDMSHGIFHEPCFYGQAYNPLAEPLFAQPFLLLGLPLRIALPLVSGILGFLPYVLIGGFLWYRKKYLSAAFAFALLIWMPIEFQVISSIPRGYIPATAFAAFGVCMALFTQSRYRFFWFAFFSLIGLSLSENSVFLSFPVGIYLWISQFKNVKFYITSAIGFIAALPVPVFVFWFYHTHPAYNLHELEFTFDYDSFLTTLQHTDLYFNFFTPFTGHKLLTILIVFIAFTVMNLAKKNIKASVSIFAGMLLFLFTLSFDKTQDGSASLFFSSVRMFLSIPPAFIIFCYWAEDAYSESLFADRAKPYLVSVLLFIAGFSLFFRMVNFKDHLYHLAVIPDTIYENWAGDSKKSCDSALVLCQKYHSGLVIIDNGRVDINYMMPALNYPVKTLEPSYERRTWEMQAEDTTKRNNFIYYPDDTDYMDSVCVKDNHIQKIDDAPAYLVKTGGRKVFDILKELGVEIRKH